MGFIMSNKVEELLNTAKLNELLHKKELEEKNKNTIVIVLAIIGAIAAVVGIAVAVYKYLAPDYLDDFDSDDMYDNFDDDFIEFSDNKPEAED
jgi:NADH:ubiquinone oxidoreductase subunit K